MVKDTVASEALREGLGRRQRRFGALDRQSKVRYKGMRGYKSIVGKSNGIVLTQWLCGGENEHDLAKEIAA